MKILVTGATGNIGRMVVNHLVNLGADDIRALSNHPERTSFPPEVEVVKGYLKRPSSLPAAFEGVDRMYLAPSRETAGEVLELARAAGVGHIVALSGDETSTWSGIAEAVDKSGLGHTHLFAYEFMENATDWADQIRATGEVREPYPDSADAPIAMEDIARVAATVLVGEGHLGKTYKLTGPETISRVQRLEAIGRAIGRDLKFVKVSRDELIEQLEPAMGEYFVRWFVDGLAARVENPQLATTTVADLTGRATTFAEWAQANADLFR
ncbi:NAD(P)H-binding protein [Nocardia sp. CDC159]|uniref:NAD(P)H-binding protein n=1 Tax=Nocardia pulmonis TaxID=2951408 RepID=A0A9X2E0C2_9NOCA|nr:MULTISPECIES: NAD(P)H-binding protein [Nocardia]MCM6771852.1 NAD(P)H-binding protein [Nocardia pulmonis]MCM6785490.1 NAD(P)H-binding protein [Nocardia sp. CDC159]